MGTEVADLNTAAVFLGSQVLQPAVAFGGASSPYK